MYAQLCRRLSEEAPNFEPPTNANGSTPSISTFRQLLLAKCRVEFENRSAAQEVFESRDGSLTADEEEQRQTAKRKMLGNIKFIGELGKLGMLQGAILHMCIQQLLERKRRGGIREMAEDLECLCQIMRTCGRILDIDKAKSLMDQYFDRMAAYAVNQELPSRIRFMMQDSIDLRTNHWQPRKIASTDGPRTIQQIREEAARDSGVYLPPPGSHLMQGMHRGGGPGGMGINPPSGLFPVSRSGLKGPIGIGLEDVFGSLPLGAVSIGTGPGVIPSMQDGYGYDSDSTHNGHGHNPNMYRGRPSYGSTGSGGSGSGGYSSSRSPSNGVGNYHGGGNNKQFSAQNHHQQNINQANNAKNDLPPRFKKMMMTQQRSQSSTEEVSLRPPANSMVNKPKPSTVLLPKSVTSNAAAGNNHITGPLGPLLDAALPMNSSAVSNPSKIPGMGLNLQEIMPIGVKSVVPTATDKQRSPRKDQGPTKEDIVKQAETVLEDLLNRQIVEDSVNALKEIKMIDRFWTPVLARLMAKVLDKSDSERELVSQLMVHLKKESLITPSNFFDGYKELVSQLPDIENDVPRAKSFVAGLAARAVMDELSTLADLARPLEGGYQYPLFLLTLQQLHKIQATERSVLIKLFNESKVQLMNMLPELDRNKDRLGEILDDRGLSFLFPLLRIQSDLWKQIQADPTPAQFYKWIKENVDPSCYTMPGFISALFAVLLKYIAQESAPNDAPTTNGSTENGSIATATDKVTQEKEKELVERYRPVLQAFLHDHVSLQVTVLHALQAFCHGLNFPKGMLLRWFVLLYDLEIIEEDAFLKWKEDLTDDTPGKGKALFQVNNWLMWLEQAESDEDEDGDA
ncbi:eukaryotic translation initiation factor 4 gamma 2-like [Daphnia pulex]|uniref:eukaryotic translation initiation factor 4 gamma 2-like n=1 Tax=Daphnia pulex TaxID=6669 RepID=UPI001EDE44AA|nr:eukaryotic translation initiation factor 4 gamma 2-like [Daphnia pulex]